MTAVVCAIEGGEGRGGKGGLTIPTFLTTTKEFIFTGIKGNGTRKAYAVTLDSSNCSAAIVALHLKYCRTVLHGTGLHSA